MTKPNLNTTPYLPGFQFKTLRRTPRSSQQKRREELAELRTKRFDHLAAMLDGFLPEDALQTPTFGPGSRERIYTKTNTFFAFLHQVWSDDGSCQDAVHRKKGQAVHFNIIKI